MANHSSGCMRTATVFIVFKFSLIFALAVVGAVASAEPKPSDVSLSGEPAKRETQDPRRAARQLAESGSTLTGREQVLIERPDRKRSTHPLTLSIFGRPLTLGGRYSVLTRSDRAKLLDFDFFDFDTKDIDGDGDVDEIEDAARGDTPRDDQLRINQTLQIDLFYPFGPLAGPIAGNASIYSEFKLFERNLVEAKNVPERHQWIVERGELWLYVGNIGDTPFGFQAGRQRFFDSREWWWDQDLDSVRLRFDLDRFHAELAVAQEVLPVNLNDRRIDPEERDILRVLGVAQWQWKNNHQVGLYALHESDSSNQQPLLLDATGGAALPCVPEDEIPANLPDAAKTFFRSGCASFEDDSDARLTWLGVSAAGSFTPRRRETIEYWLHFAGVFGKESFTDYSGPTGSRTVVVVDRHHVSGWGLDFGGIWKLDTWAQPHLTLGYAIGSGDSGMTETSNSGFRQTGLQDNSERLEGVVSFGYYGELVDPDLSNLQIVSLGFGLRFLKKSSIDFMYHYYRQMKAAPFMHDAGFKRDPIGLDPDIGQEWDVIVGVEEWEPIEFKLVGSIFRPGRAFRPEDGKLSYLLSFRVRANF